MVILVTVRGLLESGARVAQVVTQCFAALSLRIPCKVATS